MTRDLAGHADEQDLDCTLRAGMSSTNTRRAYVLIFSTNTDLINCSNQIARQYLRIKLNGIIP
jgi:hypothetical protein